MGKSSSSGSSRPKSVGKYASKFVNELISALIKKKIESKLKSPKATAKWLDKLKLSVLRKVSLTSKSIFESPEAKEDALLLRIETLKNSISDREERIKAVAMESLRNGSISDIPNRVEIVPYTPGKFESQIKSINERFAKLSQQISGVQKDIKTRVNGLRSVVQRVETKIVNVKNTANVGSKQLSESGVIVDKNPSHILSDHLSAR